MPRITRTLIFASCVGLTAILASITIWIRMTRIDHSNYTVDPVVTERVIALFDELSRTDNILEFGGSTRSTTVGSSGLGEAMLFNLRERGGMLGIHRLFGRGEDVVRFSFLRSKDANGFNSVRLSASLTEDENLRHSFDGVIDRLAAKDPSSYRWILLQTGYKSRTQEAEQAVAPNRSLPPSLNSTSSVRGSED